MTGMHNPWAEYDPNHVISGPRSRLKSKINFLCMMVILGMN